MADGKFRVEKGSSFSLAIYKELGLTKEQGNKIWNDIFTVAKEEGFGDINKVKAGQEFALSQTGLDTLERVVKEKLKKDIPTENIENKGQNTPKPRSHSEMENTTKRYKEAERIIQQLNALNTHATVFSEEAKSKLFKDINKDNLAYILKKEPQFFEKLEKKIGEEPLVKELKKLVTKLGVSVINPEVLSKKELLQQVMNIAKNNPAKREVSEEDKKIRKAADDKINAQKAAENRKKQLAKDKKALKVTIPVSSKLSDEVKEAKDTAKNKTRSVIQYPKNILQLPSKKLADKKVIAYLLQDRNVQQGFFETLSPIEKRTLLAKFIGEEEANKINRYSLDSMLLKETKKMVDKDTVALAAQSSKNTKAQDIVNNATNLIAEFKHLPTNERGIVKKAGVTVYYNKKTKNALVIERDKKNNIISIRTVSNYNPATGKMTPIIKFTPDKILCNLDGQKGTYEWHSQYGEFNKLKEYVSKNML